MKESKLKKHERSDRVKWIISFTLIILAIVMIAGVVYSVFIADNIKNDEAIKDEDTIVTEQVTGVNMSLKLSSPVTLASSITQTITATITPSDAENQEVDWSIAWSEDAPLKESKISDYLTITPQSDGALKATVACYKSFRGSTAVITVTSREGGCKATCFVNYVGKPDALTLNTSALSTTARGNVTAFLLGVGQTLDLQISVSNIFDDLGSGYDNYTVKVEGIGSFVISRRTISASGTTWDDERSLSLEAVKSDYISASIVGNTLRISGLGRYENYAGEITGGSMYTRQDFYRSDNTTNGALPYFRVTVTETASQISKSFNFYVASTVNSVDLSKDIITF